MFIAYRLDLLELIVGKLVEVLVALVTKHIITIIHMQLAVMDDAGRVELDSIVVTSTG